MAVREVKDEEILERAYKAVVEELGIAGFTLFIRLLKVEGEIGQKRGKKLLRDLTI